MKFMGSFATGEQAQAALIGMNLYGSANAFFTIVSPVYLDKTSIL
jgi:hypothetical protein